MPTFNPFGERDDTLLSLVSGVLKGENIAEERDPDDTQTGSLFKGMDDEPELQTIHHKAEMHVSVDNSAPQRFVLGSQTFNREPTESAEDFKNRVTSAVLNGGHSAYNREADTTTNHDAYSPYDGFDGLTSEEDSHDSAGVPRWMHFGASNEHSHLIDGAEEGPEHSINTQVHHFLKVGHEARPQ